MSEVCSQVRLVRLFNSYLLSIIYDDSLLIFHGILQMEIFDASDVDFRRFEFFFINKIEHLG